ncbi:hypothetical protein AA0111_g11110 [Alternaria arborescens]|uniref:hypothetical protein n=1 Tax=Alternaria arborescens TaxID=156630 RepID=UPI001074D359|nr:hypothetical protein AA0111_g11110 [Alternaria arborescens]RYO17114.1 hypothetical protein AA0111_g11110 [Alternaria arborescens]
MRSSSILVLGLAANTLAYAPQQVLSSLDLSGSSYECDNGAKPSVVCNDASDKHNCSCTCTNGIKFEHPLDPFSSATSGGSSQIVDNAACQADKDLLMAQVKGLTDDQQKSLQSQQDLLDRISTYQNTFHYQGCFTDANPHVLDAVLEVIPNITVEKCAVRCKAYKHFGINYGSYCLCGDTFANPTKEIAETQCSSLCIGDDQKRCGGHTKLSIYSKPVKSSV